MNADDVRWLAQKVVAKAFHGVSDASVEALARRVLELEQHEVALSQSLQQVTDRLGDAEKRAEMARQVERAACAKLCGEYGWSGNARDGVTDAVCRALGAAIMARGGAKQAEQSESADRMSGWRHNTTNTGMYFVLSGSMVALVAPGAGSAWTWSDCKNGKGGMAGSLDGAKAAAEASLRGGK